MAFRNQRLWTECIESLQKSIQVETQEEVKNERKIALAVALIACGNYSKAEFLLLKVEMYIKIPQLIQKAAFFRGICAIYTSKWKEAREALNIYFSHSNNKSQEMFNKINTLLVEAQNSKYKSPKLAKTLSTILPGFGQIYAGNWLSGINALLINSATGYLFFNDLLKKQYKDAIFNGFFLFERFYSGNRINAENAVRKYNQYKKQKYANQILEILQKNKYDK